MHPKITIGKVNKLKYIISRIIIKIIKKRETIVIHIANVASVTFTSSGSFL